MQRESISNDTNANRAIEVGRVGTRPTLDPISSNHSRSIACMRDKTPSGVEISHHCISILIHETYSARSMELDDERYAFFHNLISSAIYTSCLP
jgi:hypothetical protein